MRGRLAQMTDALALLVWLDKRRSEFTADEIAKSLEVSRRTAYRYLEAARALHLVDHVGGPCSGRWKSRLMVSLLQRVA